MSRLLSTLSDVWEGSKQFFGNVFGTAGITVGVCILAVFALILFWWVCKTAIGQKKLKINWWALILLIVDIILLVYFCLMY